MPLYDGLGRFLNRQRGNVVVVSFSELEGIVGHSLPASARTHRAWWSNSAAGHSHARAWLDAGWKVQELDMASEQVCFVRTREGEGKAVSPVDATVKHASGGRRSVSRPTTGVVDGGVKVADRDRLLKVLRLFAALDGIRWQHTENYNLINYCTDALPPEQKLLCHWVCYVLDRQMPYRVVWEVGGYVLSHAVLVFAERGTQGVVHDCLERVADAKGVKWHWSAPLKGPNATLRRRDTERNPVVFASRFMPADTASIIRALQFLETSSGGSFGRFVAQVLSGAGDGAEKLNRLAAALHGLTYAQVGQVNNDGLEKALETQRAAARHEAQAFTRDPEGWLAGWEKRFESVRYSSKRLWAALRDWIKSPEFNPVFVQTLASAGLERAHEWLAGGRLQQEALVALELPGDVWNNNPKLIKGLVLPCLQDRDELQRRAGSAGASWLLRQLCEAAGALEEGIYPEQFDVTFDFVRRMCEEGRCAVCPFGGGVERLCTAVPGKYCPATIMWCGYLSSCPGRESCPICDIPAQGLCAHGAT